MKKNNASSVEDTKALSTDFQTHKSPKNLAFTRALKKTRFHKAKRVFSVYRNGKFNKFADDK